MKTVTTLIDKLLQATDNGEYAVTVFLDFKKAFATVDYSFMAWKLEKAGIGPNLIKLLSNYLKGRTQATQVNKSKSTTEPVTTGVPQGSTLGPLLFILFTNDLATISNIPLFTIFADDTSVTITGKDLAEIQQSLNAFFPLLTTWCTENKLTLNPSKTQYMIFGSKNNLAKVLDINLVLGDVAINEVQSYRYLGTTLDQTLTAGNQLSRLNQQIAQKLISFRKIRKSISELTAIILYKATILPIFDYNDFYYNLLTVQQLTKMQRLQNRALRIVFCSKKLSVEEMHTAARVDYLEIRRENHLIALMFNRVWDDRYRDTTPRVTRQADAALLAIPRAKTARFARAPIVHGGRIWNDLPVKVREAKTKLALKNRIRAHRAGHPLVWAEDPA